MKRAVRSRRKVYGQLLEHVRRQPHRECCGILAGQDGLITRAFPAKNVAADPFRNYEIAPKEIVRLTGELRKRRLEFLGIYHSHPNWLDTNEPSPNTSRWPTILKRSISSSRPGRRQLRPSGHFQSGMGVRWNLKFRSYPDVNAQRFSVTPFVQEKKMNYVVVTGDKKLGHQYGLAATVFYAAARVILVEWSHKVLHLSGQVLP
jgi:hypothetical protein